MQRAVLVLVSKPNILCQMTFNQTGTPVQCDVMKRSTPGAVVGGDVTLRALLLLSVS